MEVTVGAYIEHAFDGPTEVVSQSITKATLGRPAGVQCEMEISGTVRPDVQPPCRPLVEALLQHGLAAVIEDALVAPREQPHSALVQQARSSLSLAAAKTAQAWMMTHFGLVAPVMIGLAGLVLCCAVALRGRSGGGDFVPWQRSGGEDDDGACDVGSLEGVGTVVVGSSLSNVPSVHKISTSGGHRRDSRQLYRGATAELRAKFDKTHSKRPEKGKVHSRGSILSMLESSRTTLADGHAASSDSGLSSPSDSDAPEK